MKRTMGAVLLIGVLVSCGGGSGSAALSRPAATLRSQAAEGALLARSAASGATTQTFTREHAADLLTLVESLKASLGSLDVAPALRPQLGRLRIVADRVTTDLERLQAFDGDLVALASDLQAAADESRFGGDSRS